MPIDHTYNRMQSGQSRSNGQPTEPGLSNRSVNDPLGTKPVQQTPCYLVPIPISIFSSLLHPSWFTTITHAPLYCATSSPRTNVFWLASSSSARASFNASRTVTSFAPPASDAYPRALTQAGAHALLCKPGRTDDPNDDSSDDVDSTRPAGRNKREATISTDRLTRVFNCRDTSAIRTKGRKAMLPLWKGISFVLFGLPDFDFVGMLTQRSPVSPSNR